MMLDEPVQLATVDTPKRRKREKVQDEGAQGEVAQSEGAQGEGAQGEGEEEEEEESGDSDDDDDDDDDDFGPVSNPKPETLNLKHQTRLIRPQNTPILKEKNGIPKPQTHCRR
jgi:hypothetical protein